MCGLTGFWERSEVGAKTPLARLEAMTETLRHRGPDDGGTFIDDAMRVGLGNRRLAIVDLSAHGHQPMASPDDRYVCTYNGEIYNFGALRQELEAGGQRFKGGSDTEVLVGGLARWGLAETLRRCNGMFALAVWDRHHHTLSLARDRFGEKPLYYGWANGSFLFGSELKALRAHPAFDPDIDRDALALYFRHNCVPGPFTIYQGIAKLEPGTVVVIDESTAVGTMPKPTPFWSLREVVERGATSRAAWSADNAIDELQDVLAEAVRMRMHADVPLGALLSGGIDSTLVTALMQAQHSSKIRTFTIAFEDAAYDEATHARRVAEHLGTDHQELTVTADDALEMIPRLAPMYDEPFADSSQIPTAVLAALTRRHVTVALSGDGGDELFGGYNRYVWTEHFWRRLSMVPRPLRRAAAAALRRVPPKAWDRAFALATPALPDSLRVRNPGTKLDKVAQVLPAANVHETYVTLSSHFHDPSSLVLGAVEPPSRLSRPGAWPVVSDPVELMMYLDSMTYLPDDILTKVDRAAMASSLETRLPFLDPRLTEFAWGLPLDMKVRAGQGKWLLRRLLERYVPPELTERPKAGFGIPLGSWLRGPLRPWAEELLDAGRLQHQGILDPAPVRALWNQHLSGQRDAEYLLWDVLMFEAWFDAR